jgi:hypothetical protein
MVKGETLGVALGFVQKPSGFVSEAKLADQAVAIGLRAAG